MTGALRGLRFGGMHEAYPALRDAVLKYGSLVAPRGEPTIELLGASFEIEDAVRRGVPVGCGRKVGVKMMAIDGTGNLAGASYPDVAIALAPVLDRFADDVPGCEPATVYEDTCVGCAARIDTGKSGGHRFFQGAYGPRIGGQLLRVEQQLRADPSTRQAVVSLWRESDRDARWADRPCSTELQFMLRRDGLHCFVFMRANDLWTGTCYDVWQFGQVQAALAHVLGVEPGPYHHYATSLHIYERDVEKFEAVRPWGPPMYPTPGSGSPLYAGNDQPAVDNPRESWGPDWDSLDAGEYGDMKQVQDRFRGMLELRRRDEDMTPRNEVEDWYWRVLTTGRA